MADPQEVDAQMDDEYNEDEDGDFDATAADAGAELSSSSDEGGDEDSVGRPKKRRKTEKLVSAADLGELDSGDEATIRQQRKTRRKHQRQGEGPKAGSNEELEGWRARTRAMREREKEVQKMNKLASVKRSTIDVDKLWEDMNKRGGIPLPPTESNDGDSPRKDGVKEPNNSRLADMANKENVPVQTIEEMITIKHSYKFAGEVHLEEKSVAKGSAEAQLWLAQQGLRANQVDATGKALQRPMRKISRFDPNFSNLEAFKVNWSAAGERKPAIGPKLNVVEKSKMDWAVHVDAEGLKEELNDHSKAKEGYLNRMDFLSEVEQRRDAEARAARQRGP